MSLITDRAVGPWLIRDDESDEKAIVVAKNVVSLCYALIDALESTTYKKLRPAVDQILSELEFAVVDVQKNGVIRWPSGRFANELTTPNTETI